MNTNKQNKTFKDPISLDFQDSHLKVNRNANSSVSPLITDSISKREISTKTNNSIKGNGVDRKLVQAKDTTPRPIKEEINQLAKSWCELLLGQVMEAHNQQKLIGAIEPKTIENINIDR